MAMPLEGGYWLEPSSNCLAATSRKDRGPSWSGKPCPRFMASCFRASMVMCWKMLVGRDENTEFMLTSPTGTKGYFCLRTKVHKMIAQIARSDPGIHVRD